MYSIKTKELAYLHCIFDTNVMDLSKWYIQKEKRQSIHLVFIKVRSWLCLGFLFSFLHLQRDHSFLCKYKCLHWCYEAESLWGTASRSLRIPNIAMAEDFVVVKDSKYSWLVMASVLYSMFLCGMLTFGSVSVLVYVWSEMFKLNAYYLATWAPAIMGASYQMTGRGLYCTDCNGQPNQ